jgi:hypothetical protein
MGMFLKEELQTAVVQHSQELGPRDQLEMLVLVATIDP